MTTYNLHDLIYAKGTSEPVREMLLAMQEKIAKLEAKREWQGLTDEERLALWSNIECDLECLKPAQYACAIEAKLRGKNT